MEDVLFDDDIFSDDKLYHVPGLCVSFGTGNADSCTFVPEPEDREWYDIEIASPTDNLPTRFAPMIKSPLLRRVSREPYYLTCDKSSKAYQIQLKDYPPSGKLKKDGRAGTEVPIMYPAIRCKQDTATDCLSSKWVVTDEDKTGFVTEKDWAGVYPLSRTRSVTDDLQLSMYTRVTG